MVSRRFNSFEKHFIVLLMWQSYLAVTGDIIVTPIDTEASVGERIELVCTSTIGAVDWLHLRVGTKTHDIVYKDGYVFNGYKGRFSAISCSNAGGECNLVIQNVSLKDAGTYICIETSEEALQKSAELIVYERYPSPQSCVTRITCSLECNNLELSCIMKYSGNVDAFMEWRNFAGELVPSTNFTSDGTTTSTIQLNKHQSQSMSYMCQVKYPVHNTGSRYNWTHGPQDLFTSNTVQEADNQQVTTFIVILVVVTVMLLIIISGLIGFIFWIRKRKPSRRHSFNEIVENVPLRPEDEMPELIEQKTPLVNHENDPSRPEDEMPELIEQKTPLVNHDLDLDESWTEGEIAPRTKGNKNKAIHGLSVIDNEIFLITRDGCIVEVFDLITASYLRAWSVVGLVNPNDMVSCPKRKRLYICDWKKSAEDKEIVCVDKDGAIEIRWISENEKGRLSITEESHVIVAESWYNTIKEYSPYGHLIKRFQTNRYKMHLWHAIKLRDGNFVASFGDTHDALQEVCVLDNQGETIHSFSNESVTSSCHSMAVPRTLAVDGDGTIYVADLYNGRILMLTSELNWKGELHVTRTGQTLKGPLRIYLHESESKRQLLVADNVKANGKWQNGKLLIVDIK